MENQKNYMPPSHPADGGGIKKLIALDDLPFSSNS